MPLPSLLNGAAQCHVLTKRTKLRCKNPAAYGCKACRMHGAHKSKNVLRGESHPRYKNGNWTIEAKARRSNNSTLLRYLIDIGNHTNLFFGRLRLLGRPPSQYISLNLNDEKQLLAAIAKTRGR